jgi:hypothetical protein
MVPMVSIALPIIVLFFAGKFIGNFLWNTHWKGILKL